MAKILVSWIATNNDFINNEASDTGPNYRFHEHFYKGYSKHIILSSEIESMEITSKGMRLYSFIKKNFPTHDVKVEYLDLKGTDIVNINLIQAKIHNLFNLYKDDEIDIFVSPGTPTMQIVWHIIHLQGLFKTRLLQTIKPEDTLDHKPQLLEIDISNHTPTDYLIVKENNISNKQKSSEVDYCLSKSVQEVHQLAKTLALTNKTTILILGETGTGKEKVAEIIHEYSSRKKNPFIIVNCAAINPDLLESRLFGHKKGAFTSATESKDGYFKAAHTGTIFLDEIGDINPQMQVALLRVLQAAEIQKVGSNKTEKIDIRIIAATNKDLYQCCKEGTFRWDLYYRLNVAEIQTTPLRLRGAKEIETLINFFNIKFQKQLNLNRKLIEIPQETMDFLCQYSWPGNVRELENLMERFYAYNLDVLTINKLPFKFFSTDIACDKLEDVKRMHIRKIVNLCGGNLAKASKILDVGSVNTIKAYI